MPVRKGDPLDPAATRRRVLATASRLFYERGTHPVGVNEIAGSAGVSKLTLYRHFQSKDGLVRAFLEAHTDATIAEMRRIAADEGTEAEDRILALFDGLTAAFADPAYRGCALMNTAVEWRGSDSEAGPMARRHLDRVRQVLVDLCEEAQLRSPARVADQLLLLLEGAITLRMARGPEESAGAARDAAATLLEAHRAAPAPRHSAV